MPMRKPYAPGQEAAGDAGAARVPQLPQAGRLNAQPPQPMGGNPGQQNAPMGMIGPGGRPMNPNARAGGPTAPGNIGTMLQPQVPPMQAPTPLMPWGDQGTQMAQGQMGVNRVPYEPQMPGSAGGGGMGPEVVLQLLKKMGRF